MNIFSRRPKSEVRNEAESLLSLFMKEGKEIKVIEIKKRTSNSMSWDPSRGRGSIAHRGSKANCLRAKGFSKAQ